MKKIKIILFSILTILIFSISIHNVYADMGPKPAAYIDITGIEGEYVACFAAKEEFGPNRFYDGDTTEPSYHPIQSYIDEDGYKYLARYFECVDETRISFTYYCPDEFKIVIYKDNALYKVTEPLKRYAYSAYYEIDFSTGTINTPEEIKVAKTYNYGREILEFLIRVALTLIIEIGLFFLIQVLYTKHNFKVVLLTNIITQVLLNAILNINSFYLGKLDSILLLFIMEIIVLVIELVSYNMFMKDKNKFVINVYTVFANVLSFGLGLILLLFV